MVWECRTAIVKGENITTCNSMVACEFTMGFENNLVAGWIRNSKLPCALDWIWESSIQVTWVIIKWAMCNWLKASTVHQHAVFPPARIVKPVSHSAGPVAIFLRRARNENLAYFSNYCSYSAVYIAIMHWLIDPLTISTSYTEKVETIKTEPLSFINSRQLSSPREDADKWQIRGFHIQIKYEEQTASR